MVVLSLNSALVDESSDVVEFDVEVGGVGVGVGVGGVVAAAPDNVDGDAF